jgi:hypothetical protein
MCKAHGSQCLAAARCTTRPAYEGDRPALPLKQVCHILYHNSVLLSPASAGRAPSAPRWHFRTFQGLDGLMYCTPGQTRLVLPCPLPQAVRHRLHAAPEAALWLRLPAVGVGAACQRQGQQRAGPELAAGGALSGRQGVLQGGQPTIFTCSPKLLVVVLRFGAGQAALGACGRGARQHPALTHLIQL